MNEPAFCPEPENLAVHDSLLLIFADALDDLERTRIATENRVRSLRQVKGMDDTPEEARLLGLVDALASLEHGAELELKRALRQHPLGSWVKRTIGIGEKQGARLLAAVGDPYLRAAGTPRTVSQLWAYCGYHVLHPGPTGHDPRTELAGVAAKRRRGQQANWNPTAKMRAFLCAQSCIKQAHSPYRAVYDARRARTAVTHPEWSHGHSHNDGMRIVAKAILRDLWIESRRLSTVGAQPSMNATAADSEIEAA